jgi:hypothetical protein
MSGTDRANRFVWPCLALLLVVLIAAAGAARAADIEVTTDRDQVGMNESFNIVFRADGSPDGDPDFTPLEKNFQILSTSQSSNFTLLNGDLQSSKTWTLTVLPRHSGNLTIPAIAFGSDRSPRSSIMVSRAEQQRQKGGDADIFLRAGVKPQQPYVQSQVIYNLKLYRAVPTSNASLAEPEVSEGEAVIERIGEDKQYITRVRGKRYRVVERDYAVYPQASGALSIAPVEFRGRVSRNSYSLMDPFGPRSDMVVRRSRAVNLKVRPIPDAFAGSHWFPAGKVTLQEEWSQSPMKLTVGEPVTRTLVLSAEGQTASQLPELPEQVPSGFRHYPDQPELENDTGGTGITGTRREKTALIPDQPGEYTLPAVRIPWWDTDSDSMRYAELPERTVTVAAAPGQQPQAGGAPVQPEPLEQLRQPAPSAKTPEAAGTAGAQPAAQQEDGWNPWLLLSLALVLIWLLTVAAWWFSSRRRGGPGGDSRRRVLGDLRQACRQGDPRRARERLQQWGRLNWPEDPPANPLELGRRLDPRLEQAVRQLNDSLYSSRPGEWRGGEFWDLFEEVALKRKRGREGETGKLEPLHRL